jgi:hypothetical protein
VTSIVGLLPIPRRTERLHVATCVALTWGATFGSIASWSCRVDGSASIRIANTDQQNQFLALLQSLTLANKESANAEAGATFIAPASAFESSIVYCEKPSRR